ncbi:cyclin-dependent kinase 4 inhibitor C isoform X2 [Cololabis saira]|uniref:cyclin-dependent kinase 4 inhibitor C isoform X2 n=1 Tax=Cololabis saira TaxID=129043 RepID=UPI002AD40949|nr:cyclin-dependent kinase 4 inhibitor C isoform X2 [Cololabis saira]
MGKLIYFESFLWHIHFFESKRKKWHLSRRETWRKTFTAQISFKVVMLGHSRLIQVLLAAGADPDLPDPRLGLTVTHDAARQGFGESVRVLVSGGADVNLLDWDGNLPLHLAAAGGHLEALRALLPRTADPGQADGWGRSPWRLAIDHQQLDAAAAISQYLDHD